MKKRHWKTYPKFKNSGIEWLGDVPEHWEIKRLRFIADVNPVKSEVLHLPPNTEVSFVPMEAVSEFGGLRLNHIRMIDDVYQSYTYFREGDVVIAKITPCFENGKGSIAEGLTNNIGFGTTELHVVRPGKNLDRRFFFFLSISSSFRQPGEAEMYGAGGQKRVPDSFIRNYRIPSPLLAEQQQIVKYLGAEWTRINALIEKKERQIELLQEKRSALISRAVTKGLNPNAKMKPSGIEWLGEIPAHWEVKRLRFVAALQTGNTPPKSDDLNYADEGLMWVKPDNLSGLKAIVETKEYLSEVGKKLSHPVPAKAALVCCIGTVGKFGYSAHEAATNQQINAVIFNPKRVLSDFGVYLIASAESEHIMRANTNVVTILNSTQQSNIVMPIPSLTKQRAIATFLNRETARIDALIGKVKKSITLLREYRTALISAAVTGKIDVRKEAA